MDLLLADVLSAMPSTRKGEKGLVILSNQLTGSIHFPWGLKFPFSLFFCYLAGCSDSRKSVRLGVV
jgi:hypothetical protein